MEDFSTPRNLEAFTIALIDIIREIKPDAHIIFVRSGEILLDNRRFDVTNLYKIILKDGGNARLTMIIYIEQIIESENGLIKSGFEANFAEIKSFIMPRIQPEDIFQNVCKDQVAHVPFVNGTVIVFVQDLPSMTVTLTNAQSQLWGVTSEELDIIARANLKSYVDNIAVDFMESKYGGRCALISIKDGYDAARLLLSDLHRKISPELGQVFYVGIPARDLFVAFSANSPIMFDQLQKRIQVDYEEMPYPITPNVFLVTQDGIASAPQI